jgi:amicyanin
MKKNQLFGLAAGAVVIIAIIIGGVFLTGSKPNNMNMGSNSSSNADAVATDKVDIKGYAFSPAVIKVKVGTTVTWTNQDAVSHTVTGDDTSSAEKLSSSDIQKGGTYTHTFKTAGTYKYHCFPHPYMHGTVVVTN